MDKKRVQLIKFINLIDENYTQGLSVSEYARLLLVSTRTLSDLTNQLLNKTQYRKLNCFDGMGMSSFCYFYG